MYSIRKNNGFTIVELLVVIVVVGILSTLGLSSYANAKADAADSIRRSDLAAIIKSFEAFAIDNDTYRLDGYGWNAEGTGWVNFKNPTSTFSYEKTIIEGLADYGYPLSNAKDPYISENLNEIWQSGQAYMVYLCFEDGLQKVGVFAKLENPEPADQARIDGWVNAPCNAIPVAAHGMNHVIESTGRTTNKPLEPPS